MMIAVVVHYVGNANVPNMHAAAPAFVCGNTIGIVKDGGRGQRASFALEECIDIYTASEGHAKIYASSLKVGCQRCRVVMFRLYQPLKRDIILARVTSRKPLYVFGTQLTL